MDREDVVNFAAGPASISTQVLAGLQADLLNFKGSGMSVMELSHRGAVFKQVIDDAEANLRKLMAIPDNYKVLFVQGGGSTQFSAVPLNLFGEAGATADYVVSGSWSKKAAAEAKKYGAVNIVNEVSEKFTDVAPAASWKLTPGAKYLYYCSNETVNGVELAVPEGVNVVTDMSSNILSQAVDVSKFAVIYAGAQKNVGCTGVTIVIVRDDLLGNALPCCPVMLDYGVLAKGGSMYNTPPTWSIYVAGEVFKWMLAEGGVAEFASRSAAKSGRIYGVIDASAGFYVAPVASAVRSRMNIPFRITDGSGNPSEEVEGRFLKEAEAKGFMQLKGHRSVGGIRASIYNAITVEKAEQLAVFMEGFAAANTP